MPAVLALDDDTRVPFYAATPEDLDQAARYHEQEHAEFSTELRNLATMVREQGLTRVAELVEVTIRDA